MKLHVTLLLIAALLMPGKGRADDVYIMEPPLNRADHRKEYTRFMLKAALEATKKQFGPYRMEFGPVAMEHKRLLQELIEGRMVNVTSQLTTPEWERKVIPIRIPLDKGITNFRVSLIDGRRQAEFSRIQSLEQLRRLTVGLGAQWTVLDVYTQNGFNVVTGNDYTGLFGMLEAKRFDYLPRSIAEADVELPVLASQFPDLALEQSFALYVPLPLYLFVSPAQPRLAERLRVGLEDMIASGEFDRIFLDYYGRLIAKSGLCTRRVFHIDNPTLGPETPSQRMQLWFDPSKSKSNALTCQAAANLARQTQRH